MLSRRNFRMKSLLLISATLANNDQFRVEMKTK